MRGAATSLDGAFDSAIPSQLPFLGQPVQSGIALKCSRRPNACVARRGTASPAFRKPLRQVELSFRHFARAHKVTARRMYWLIVLSTACIAPIQAVDVLVRRARFGPVRFIAMCKSTSIKVRKQLVRTLSVAFILSVGSANSDLWSQDAPVYPRVNVSDSYVVDANWPRPTPDIPFAAVPGVAVDRLDRVWVCVRTNPPVRLYAPDGHLIRAWGDNYITTIHSLRIDSEGNVWVTDVGSHLVMKFSAEGRLLLELGTRGQAGQDDRHFNMPTDLAVTPRGDVFVTDGYGNSRIVHLDRNGRFVKAWGTLGSCPGQFSIPHSIVIDSKGRLYVADRNNARIQVFRQDGRLLDEWRNLVTPWGLWIGPNDQLWVCGSSPMTWESAGPGQPLGCPPKDQLFAKFSTAGKMLGLWTVPKGVDRQEKPGELNWVHGIALDSKGNIYVGDIIGRRIQKFVLQPGWRE